MQRIDELIEQFWAGRLSPEEKQLLAELLSQQQPTLTDTMQKTFFAIKAEGQQIINPERARAIRQQLDIRIATEGADQQRTIPIRKISWAAAAIIAFAISTFIVTRQKQNHDLAKQHPTIHQLKNITNRTPNPQTLTLSDSSVVQLQANSSLSYYEPFYDSSRDISLTGAATFRVAKLSRRPFTVYASGIATTALGTTFTVDNRESGQVNVLLLEGKVIVQPAQTATSDRGSGLQPVTLDPGQQVTMNILSHQSLVSRPNQSEPKTATKSVPQPNKNTLSATLSFSNEPLSTVFQKLNKLYSTDIRWDRQNIEGLYFTGTILKGDSIRTVLAAICNMNRLTFTQEKGYIQVKKSN